ncbi:hypothetical protein [Streptomyces sp. NRRL F-4489]|uniref:hypothetical protein n=1 Tax=Streptomyces sp. NRRL F-4489 TaxID=1609095 RepID=UPI000AA91FE6|nr:hypothetical protein [Streptomyces sp. NRRL F-4489]
MEYAPRPWSTSREQQVDDTLAALTRPVAQGTWNPPKPVYGTHGKRWFAPTLADALNVDSVYPPPQREHSHAG